MPPKTKGKKLTLLNAHDRGRIDEIIKALKFLEEGRLLNYSLEIELLEKIRSW